MFYSKHKYEDKPLEIFIFLNRLFLFFLHYFPILKSWSLVLGSDYMSLNNNTKKYLKIIFTKAYSQTLCCGCNYPVEKKM